MTTDDGTAMAMGQPTGAGGSGRAGLAEVFRGLDTWNSLSVRVEPLKPLQWIP